MQDDQVEDVAAESDACGDQHELAIDISRVLDAVDGFRYEPAEKSPNDENTREGANHIGAVVSVRVFQVALPGRNVNRDERDDKAGNVGQLMRCVGQDGERARQDSAHGFHSAEYGAYDGHED